MKKEDYFTSAQRRESQTEHLFCVNIFYRHVDCLSSHCATIDHNIGQDKFKRFLSFEREFCFIIIFIDHSFSTVFFLFRLFFSSSSFYLSVFVCFKCKRGALTLSVRSLQTILLMSACLGSQTGWHSNDAFSLVHLNYTPKLKHSCI